MTYRKDIILFGIKLMLILKKEFDSEPVYNKKVHENQNKTYGDEASDFRDKEISKVGSDCACLAEINNWYCSQKQWELLSLLKECKYIEKEVIRYINEDIETFPRDSDEE